jgi:hypothetical protein
MLWVVSLKKLSVSTTFHVELIWAMQAIEIASKKVDYLFGWKHTFNYLLLLSRIMVCYLEIKK